MKNFNQLKKLHRELRDKHEESFKIRIHRALSWLKRAEKETGDSDARFIFYWISLNSSYSMSNNLVVNLTEKKKFKVFCKKILIYGNEEIYEVIYDRFSEEIRSLMANKFILPAYWNLKKQSLEVDQSSLTIERRLIRNALRDKNETHQILNAVFTRLFVLRNQIFHGGSTWHGKLNRRQVDDGSNLLSYLIPIILEVMMKNPNEDWGEIAYPPA